MAETREPSPTRKTALAPDVRRLDDRAARAWTERMAVRPVADGRYAVDSASGATYVVDLEARSCTCPDHAMRGEVCKHMRRVAIEISTRRVPPPGERLAVSAVRQVGRGDVVRDRETGDRLVVESVTDRRADEVTVEAAAVTVADYETNEEYPDDDIVVEAVYLSDCARETLRHYAFPRSRLERVDDAALVDGVCSCRAGDV